MRFEERNHHVSMIRRKNASTSRFLDRVLPLEGMTYSADCMSWAWLVVLLPFPSENPLDGEDTLFSPRATDFFWCYRRLP